MNTVRQCTRCAAFLAAFVAMAAVAYAADSQDGAKEKELIEKLRSDSPAAEKAIACKQLAVYGSKEAVPELAKLLTDEQLASWSRIALEAIPGPEADEALRKAHGFAQGPTADRHDQFDRRSPRRRRGRSLDRQLQNSDADVASAAAVALGRIGNGAATKTLRGSLAARTAESPQRGRRGLHSVRRTPHD